MHILHLGGSPGADFLGTTTIGLAQGMDALLDDSHTFQCLDFLLKPAVMFKRQCVGFLTNGVGAVSHVYMHCDEICMANILTV